PHERHLHDPGQVEVGDGPPRPPQERGVLPAQAALADMATVHGFSGFPVEQRYLPCRFYPTARHETALVHLSTGRNPAGGDGTPGRPWRRGGRARRRTEPPDRTAPASCPAPPGDRHRPDRRRPVADP